MDITVIGPVVGPLVGQWMINYLVHSSLLIGLMLGLERLAALRHPLRRERLWRAALVLGVISAGVQTLWPVTAEDRPGPMTVAVSPAALNSEVSKDLVARPVPDGTVAPRLKEASSPPSTASAVRDWLSAHWLSSLVLAWLALAAFLLLRLAVSARVGLRLLADRRAIPQGIPQGGAGDTGPVREREIADALAAEAGLRRPPSLSASRRINGPVTLPGAEICLPERALETLDDDRLRAMLAHEMGHVLRRDPEWRLAVNAACALLYFQPLNLLVRAKLAECAELACDDWAAGQTRDGRALAECLVEVATWMHPMPTRAFAIPMTEHGAGLTERVKRLLGGRFGDAGSGWRERGLAVSVLVALVVAAPGLVIMDADALSRDEDGRYTTTKVHDDEMSLSLATDDRHLKILVEGEVRFSEAEDEIVFLEHGGRLRIDDEHAGVERELVMEGGTGGEPLLVYFEVDGKDGAFDAEARPWLSSVIPEIYRMSGLDAEARTGRIFRRGGADAVLEEIRLIRSDHVQGLYLSALFRMDDLTEDELVSTLRLAGETISSDFELRRTLTAALPALGESSRVSASFLESARSIGSDFEAAELLIASWEHLAGGRAVEDAYFGLAEGIGSDFEMRRALEAALTIPWMVETEATRLLALSGKLGSDFEQSEFLVTFSQVGGLSAEDQQALIRASEGIGSDYEHARALEAAGRAMDMDAGTATLLLRTAARKISSDHELAELLLALAPELPEDPDVAGAYEEAAETLSDHDYGRVMRAR